MASSSALVRPGTAPWSPRGYTAAPTELKTAKAQCARAFQDFELALRTQYPNLEDRFKSLCEKKQLGIGDIVDTVNEIVDKANKQHPTNDRSVATKSTTLLQRIKDFAMVGDIIVGGAQNLIVSGVWGSVRLAIEVSLSWLTFYEKVSAMLWRIGKFLQINEEFETLFPDSVTLQALACEYMAGVVDISTRIVIYASKTSIKQTISALVSGFENEFNGLEARLDVIARSMKAAADNEAVCLNQAAHSKTHSLAGKTYALIHNVFGESRLERRQALRARFVQSLSKSQDRVRTAWKRHFTKGVSDWLLKTIEYTSWKSSETSSCLWLQGNLGSGKSVALASAIADLSKFGDPTTGDLSTLSFYFCDDFDNISNRASVIIGSLVRQVLDSKVMEASLNTYLDTSAPSKMYDTDPDASIDLLIEITSPYWDGFFVIDGLDQCNPKEVSTLVDQLSRLSDHRHVNFLFSSRTNWRYFIENKAKFKQKMVFETLTMESMNRESEASRYIDKEMAGWGNDKLSKDTKEAIRYRLMIGWGRMFLWLVLQLQLIRDELLSGITVVNILARLPEDLSDVYERMLAQIPTRHYSLTPVILQLVTAADPPLTLKELRTAANIHPCNLKWAPENLTGISSAFCWRYGGYLLEVDGDDDKVRFIHPSVAMHLTSATQSTETQNLHFDLYEAQKRLGVACLTLLNFEDGEIELHRTHVEPPTAQPSSWTFDRSVNENRMVRWLQSKYTGAKGGAISPIYAINYAQSIVAKTEQQQTVPSDFMSYTRAHWLEAIRDLSLDWREQSLLQDILLDKTPHGFLPEKLRHPQTGVLWAIEESHRPLFTCHFSDLRLSREELDWEHNVKLQTLLFSRWTDLDARGPLLIPFLDWIERHGKIVPERNDLARIILLGFPKAPNRKSADTRPLQDLATRLLPMVLNSTMNNQEFHAAIDRLKPYTYPTRPGKALVPVIRSRKRVPDRLKILFTLGAHPDEPVYTTSKTHIPIHEAFDQRDMEAIEVLCRHNAGVDLDDDEDRTCLMKAVQDESLETVQLLLRYSASVGMHDKDSRTALHHAAIAGHPEILQCLIRIAILECKVFTLNAHDIHGETPLFLALQQKHRNCAEILLASGGQKLFEHDGQKFYVKQGDDHRTTQWSLDSLIAAISDVPELESQEYIARMFSEGVFLFGLHIIFI